MTSKNWSCGQTKLEKNFTSSPSLSSKKMQHKNNSSTPQCSIGAIEGKQAGRCFLAIRMMTNLVLPLDQINHAEIDSLA
jgi:hypothetical protein